MYFHLGHLGIYKFLWEDSNLVAVRNKALYENSDDNLQIESCMQSNCMLPINTSKKSNHPPNKDP